MKLQDIHCVGAPVAVPTEAEITAVESSIGTRLPAGYRDFLTNLGEGVLGGSFVRVFPPWRIMVELEGWRARIDEYWFWDDGAETLSQQQALECVVVGDTLNGDELIFHPDDPDRVYVLPRDEVDIFVAGTGLFEALDWLCSSGTLTEPFAERDFEPMELR